MALNVKSFSQLVQDQAAAVQTKSSKLIDFATGSILLAVAQANAAVALWLQGMIIYVLSVTRLRTSQGADVDTWVNDWGLTRLLGTIATGAVTYTRFTTQGTVLVPVGAQVQTADGSQLFNVVADPSNPVFTSSQNGYLVPEGIDNVTVPVVAVSGGSGANVVAGAVNVMYSNVIGMDIVVNALPFAGGSNAETDDALKARFIQYIASLSKATVAAIQYAVASLQLGLQSTVIENMTPDGTSTPGFIWVTVDDGSGAPPANVIEAAAVVVGQTRAAGIMWGVFPPQVIPANIVVTIVTLPGYIHETVVGTVAVAISNYVNSLGLGVSLSYLRLAQVIYDSTAGIQTVDITLNGARGVDLPAAPQNTIKISTLTVS